MTSLDYNTIITDACDKVELKKINSARQLQWLPNSQFGESQLEA